MFIGFDILDDIYNVLYSSLFHFILHISLDSSQKEMRELSKQGVKKFKKKRMHRP